MAKKVQLKDSSGNKCYPVTRDECILSGDKTLLDVLSNLDNKIVGVIQNKYINREGAEAKFDRLCYIEIPYNSGDKIEITNAVSGGKYDKYNFFNNEEFISSNNELTDIPTGCTLIKVNGKIADGFIIYINGAGFNTDSKIAKNAEDIAKKESDIAKNAEDIAKNAEDIAKNAEDISNVNLEIECIVKNAYISKEDGSEKKFERLCYSIVSYKQGDILEVQNSANGASYDNFNFFENDSFISSSNELTGIPNNTNVIKINGKLTAKPVILKNGNGVDINTKIAKNAEDIAKNAEDIAKNAEAVDSLSKELYDIYTNYFSNYGKDGIWNGSKTIEQSVDNNIYTIISDVGTYISAAPSSSIEEGRKLAYFVDVEFADVPNSYNEFKFGLLSRSLGGSLRKTVRASDFGYENFVGKRIQSVYKADSLVGDITDNNFCIITNPSSNPAGTKTTFKIHKALIIDCGTDSNSPLYNLSEDEILNIFNVNFILSDDKVLIKSTQQIEGFEKTSEGFVFKKEDELIAKITQEGVFSKDFKSLNGENAYRKSSLFGEEFFSIGDSLFAGNYVQNELAKLTGSTYDADFHNTNSINYGGTSSSGIKYTSGQVRLKRLLELKTPKVIVFENINDLLRETEISAYGNKSDIPYMVGNITDYEIVYNSSSEASSAWSSNKQQIISSISSIDRSLGHAIRIKYKANNGKKLTITGTPKNGNFSIRVNGYLTQVSVLQSDTISDIIGKIEEIAFPNCIKETDNSTYIAFLTEDGNNAELSYFGQGNCGLTFSNTDYEGISALELGFTSKDISEFEDTSKWVNVNGISKWSLYKGMFDYCRKKVPTCRLIWFQPTRLPIAWTDGNENYKAELWYADGTINMDAWEKSDNGVWYKLLKQFQKEVCEMYSVQAVDIDNICGISASNVQTYYPEFNVHPYEETYKKWAWGISNLLL